MVPTSTTVVTATTSDLPTAVEIPGLVLCSGGGEAISVGETVTGETSTSSRYCLTIDLNRAFMVMLSGMTANLDLGYVCESGLLDSSHNPGTQDEILLYMGLAISGSPPPGSVTCYITVTSADGASSPFALMVSNS